MNKQRIAPEILTSQSFRFQMDNFNRIVVKFVISIPLEERVDVLIVYMIPSVIQNTMDLNATESIHTSTRTLHTPNDSKTNDALCSISTYNTMVYLDWNALARERSIHNGIFVAFFQFNLNARFIYSTRF